MNSQNILITGISRGLGKFLSDYLADKNFQIFGTVRAKLNAKPNKKINYYFLDLENPETFQNTVDQILCDSGGIDVIIHNAGIAYLNPVDELSEEERRHIFEVNFFGPISFTEKILPSFRESPKSQKIIFMSSIASIDPWPSLGVYSASKSALEKVAFEWAVLLRRWNIFVSIIRPNPLPTDMNILKTQSKKSVYGEVFCNELEWESIEDTCKILEEIINSPTPKLEYSTGPLSKKTTDLILVENTYQKLMESYISKIKNLLKNFN